MLYDAHVRPYVPRWIESWLDVILIARFMEHNVKVFYDRITVLF